MSKTLLNIDQSEIRNQIQKEFGKTEKDAKECIEIIQKWAETQPHWPQVPSKKLIRTFLFINKFSMEKTKQRLDMYYTMRGLMPEFFNKHPLSSEMIQQSKVSYFVPLPKPAQNHRRVIYSKITNDYGPDKFNYENYMSFAQNVLELLLYEDELLGIHFVFDCEYLKVGHIPKFNPLVLKKASIIIEKVYSNRVASVHLVNFHPFLESLLGIFKRAISPKIASRMYVHSSSDTLFDHLPRDIMPEDVGGEEMSLRVLNDMWLKKFSNYEKHFEDVITLRTNESLRPAKLVNDEILGYYGNFKALDVDYRSGTERRESDFSRKYLIFINEIAIHSKYGDRVMAAENLLHTDREAVRKLVLETLGKTEADVLRALDQLRKWNSEFCEDYVLGDNALELFLIINKFNWEKCVQKIETYYKISSIVPELYVNKNPRLWHMKEIADVVYCIPLPKLTPTLSRVIVFRLRELDSDKFHPYDFFAHTYNVAEIRLREDMVLTDTLFYDFEGMKLSHFLKLTPIHLKKSSTVFERVFSSRVEGIHYLNMPSSMDKLVRLVKLMLKEKIRKRVHVHKNLESLYKHLPRDVLPSDYGGHCQPLSELHELWKRKLEDCQGIFDDLEKVRSLDTSSPLKDPAPSEPDGFRNLCLD
ncbi:uncharacterized protein LOC132706435 [Cylas formicarius]|uniref:uncharacterized protein LOC132706435 n=1 Tax=Cylas formicarius TaxID=197179 RepID=UPI00295887B0|nr:uncharacterized protein LOC132706435 [Cylas formicarius]